MKRKLINVFKVLLGLYVVLCGLLYFFQEKLIFFPQKLEADYQFNFNQNFEELNIEAADGTLLNGLLFKADNAKGLIFYLHGNAGSLRSWGNIAATYTTLDYDVFILDYRSYGKSEGVINGQDQLYADNQAVYNALQLKYDERDIIVLGYSIGTGMASKLASDNHPKQLILQAPYYNLTDMMRSRFSFIPTFILKYKFANNEYLADCDMPVTIFHGTQDGVIDYDSSVRLRAEFPSKVNLISLVGQGHNGMSSNEEYQNELRNVLAK